MKFSPIAASRRLTMIAGIAFAIVAGPGETTWGQASDDGSTKQQEIKDLSALIAQLENDDAASRWQAARDLGRLGDEASEAVPALLDALDDPDVSVRLHAATALGRIGDSREQVVRRLMRAVGDEKTRVRLAAVNSVRQLVADPAKLVPLAVDLLEQDDQLLVSRAIETIIMRGEKAVPFLIEALGNKRAAYWACLAIEEMGKTARETQPALTRLIARTEDRGTKVQALLALGKLGPPSDEAREQILSALSADSGVSVQTAAAFAAGSLEISGATDRLEKTRESDDKLLSMVSAWALAKLQPENEKQLRGAVEKLVLGLASDDPTVRLTAAETLQMLPPHPELVGPRLVELLDESDPVVAFNVVEALASLGPEAARRAGKALQSEEFRGLAVQVLKRLGPDAEPAVPQMVETLRDTSGMLREQLQLALAAVGPAAAPAVDELLDSLDRPSGSVRTTAVLALGKIGPAAQKAAPAVKEHLRETSDRFEQIAAAWALVKVSDQNAEAVETAMPFLVEGLQFPDPMVRSEIVALLGDLGPAAKPAIKPLRKLAENPQAPRPLRDEATEAIDKIQ